MPITGSQRHLFDIPDDVTYLNAAYLAPQLRERRAAGIRALNQADAPWTISVETFFEPVERLRSLFADLIGGDAEGVAIVPAVSYGVGVAAANLPVPSGRTVVVLAEQFPANVYPWRAAIDRDGGEIVTVRRPQQGAWTASVLDAIDDRTAVVAVPNCHWTDGSLLDLVEVGKAARDVGSALVVDATQSLGAMPFSVKTIQPDFVVAAGYKWLLGPFGLGYMWVAPERRDGAPVEENWITRFGADDFAGLVDYHDEYAPGARRFDVGERSSFQLVPMATAALEQILGWGIDEVAQRLGSITATIEQMATERGLSTIEARAAHMIGVHLYNDTSDVDRLFSVLDTVL
jgi:selenocysteine lyase/cysteine desulfurase